MNASNEKFAGMVLRFRVLRIIGAKRTTLEELHSKFVVKGLAITFCEDALLALMQKDYVRVYPDGIGRTRSGAQLLNTMLRTGEDPYGYLNVSGKVVYPRP